MGQRRLDSRQDVALLLLDWLRPLKNRYSPGGAWLHLGENSAPYGSRDVALEGYARILWGLAPLVSQDHSALPAWAKKEIDEWAALTRQGLIHGTDPAHAEYWQVPGDHDHKFVEMAAISHGILLAPHIYWQPLTPKQKENIIAWFSAINGKKIYGNNWISFRILVNAMLYKLGAGPLDEGFLQDIAVFESNYEAEGWYHDGHSGQKDYYIPFALHFYGLLTAVQLEAEMPEYAGILKSRAQEFFRDFVYWFDGRGRSVPFGRSLTYRFAHTAAFAAMAYAGVDLPMGQLRHLVLENLRDWCAQPIFGSDGILSIGYGYPNLCMSELYNSSSSPYWSFKTFLILALPEDHPLWTAREEIPLRQPKKLLPRANMIAVREHGDHALLYPAGHFAAEVGNMAAKYQKFVYSSAFGFSVSRGNTLASGGFDCTLAVTEAGDDFWRTRHKCTRFTVTETCTRTLYCLMKGVWAESLVIPLELGHVRVHYLRTDRAVELADGGFAIGKEQGMLHFQSDMVTCENGNIHCSFPWGTAGAVSLFGKGAAELVSAFPNTNLMRSLTVIPTLRYAFDPGEAWFAGYFYGTGEQKDRPAVPQIQLAPDRILLSWGGETITLEGKLWL